MAIQLYCGRPGSGKSYGVVENVIVPALQTQRKIYTNIPLHLDVIECDYPGSNDRIYQYANEDVTGDWLLQLPGGALVIIDEAWRYWPGGMKANDMDIKAKEFFAEHRHKSGQDDLTQEIVLLTQTPAQLAKVVRDLVDQSVLTVKNSAAGSNKTFNVRVFPGCLSSIDKPTGELISGIGRYKPEVYKYYKSHTKSETGLPGVEIRADKRGNIWNHWYIRYVVPIIIILSIWGAFYLYDFFTGKKIKGTTKIEQTVPSVDRGQKIATTQQKPAPQIKRSLQYRISTVFSVDGIERIFIETADDPHLIEVGLEQCNKKRGGYQCFYEGEIVDKNSGQRPVKEKYEPTKLTQVVPEL